jgi:hypothetical protein
MATFEYDVVVVCSGFGGIAGGTQVGQFKGLIRCGCRTPRGTVRSKARVTKPTR